MKPLWLLSMLLILSITTSFIRNYLHRKHCVLYKLAIIFENTLCMMNSLFS